MIKSTQLLFVLLLSTFSLFGQNNGFEVIKSLEHMDEIYEHLDKYFVDEVPTGSLSKTAIDAMLNELDPYTVYYHESNIEDYQLMTTGQYGGIGAVIRKIGDWVEIAEPYEGSPSQKAGLIAGDRIISIEGRDMKNKSTADVSKSLKGPKGSSIKVEILRYGTKKIINITRDEIKLPNVPYYGLLENNTGYIKLNSFTQTASQDVKKSFSELKSKGMTSLILDLRGNGGGLLIEAVKIVNMFVPKHQSVVKTKGRIAGENRDYKTLEEPMDLDINLVVLVDGGSASASEIVAGSLQDLDRAVIVGTQSFGKGLVQRVYDLSYGAKMKLTIAKYYTPSGRCVQRLEYYDKLDSDLASEIPDSLVTIFKTKNGRDVIDGRGVSPDLTIEGEDVSPITLTLFRNSMFYQFANTFVETNSSISDVDTFEINDEAYEKFKAFVIDKKLTYNTQSEIALQKMKETAEAEGYFSTIEQQYNQMLKEVTPSIERDLIKFEKQIRQLLTNEIISRYYYQQGRAIHALKSDEQKDEAIRILNDLKAYNTILKK